MKYIFIFIVFLTLGIRSNAQVDTGRLNIRLQMKQKHASMAANYFSPILDQRFKDSLKIAIGSGNNPDSVINFLWPVRRLVAFHIRLSAENSGGAATLYREFLDAKVGEFGFVGIRVQLEARAAQPVEPAKSIATYILRNINQWEAVQTAVLLERIKLGKGLIDIDESDY
jgi:hypothetical protein